MTLDVRIASSPPLSRRLLLRLGMASVLKCLGCGSDGETSAENTKMTKVRQPFISTIARPREFYLLHTVHKSQKSNPSIHSVKKETKQNKTKQAIKKYNFIDFIDFIKFGICMMIVCN